MAQKTISVNASASLSASGTSSATGSITWAAPALPADVSAWDAVTVSGTWTWSGKGSISRVTINGTNTSTGVSFNVNINGKTSPLSITCVGNKNATGSSFTWASLKVNYTYTEPFVDKTTAYVKQSGAWREVAAVYKKVGGSWVEQTDLETAFDSNANYVFG